MNLFTRIISWIILPTALSPFERRYLGRANRAALGLLLAHLPVFVAVAWLNETGPLLAACLTSLVLAGPIVAHVALDNPRRVSLVYAIASMALGGLLVHFGEGPMQIEMHFYFLVVVAILAVFGNPSVIVAATAAVVAHHLVFWFVARDSAFATGAPFMVVLLHGLFVLLDAVAACFVARTFFDNVIGLERIVATRTDELKAKESALRTILDHVDHGFCTIDLKGRVASGRSAALDSWFGPPGSTSTPVFDLFERLDPAFALLSRVAWEQVIDNVFPVELLLGQMPKELHDHDRIFQVRYREINTSEARTFLVIVSDVTAERARAHAEVERREVLHIVERLVSDRSAFLDFFDEATGLVANIASRAEDRVSRARALHTLKGNGMLFGLESVATICEALETELQDDGILSDTSLARLERRWTQVSTTMDPIVGLDRGSMRISFTEHAALEAAIRKGAPAGEVLQRVHQWRLESLDRRLELCAKHLRRLAAQRAIQIDVKVDGHGLGIESSSWTHFWNAFIHVLRNVVSHGIEPEAERAALGKPLAARVALESALRGDELTIEVTDDGPGIDWAAIALRARERGMPATTRTDLERALFSDGVSTAVEVDAFAGRGVGASALLAATTELGGHIAIASEPGTGTCFRFVFPRAAMDRGQNAIRTNEGERGVRS